MSGMKLPSGQSMSLSKRSIKELRIRRSRIPYSNKCEIEFVKFVPIREIRVNQIRRPNPKSEINMQRSQNPCVI